MDLLKTLVLYMSMIFASSVQSMPDAESFMVQYATPEPVVQATVEVVATPSPTPVPTIAVSPNPEYKTLQMGDNGEEVLRLQQALADYGYYEGELDGRYGNQTRYAVEKFQYNHGLVADGIAGKYTLTVLYDSNQVRYAQPTPTPTPEGDSLTAALPQETPAPEAEVTPEPTVQVTAEPEPQQTSAPTEAPAPSDTPAPEAAEPTAQPAFEAMEGWVIRLADLDQPLVISTEQGKETVTSPVLPYQLGDVLYVPLFEILEGEGVLVVASTGSVDKVEFGFAMGERLYRLAFTENREGDPTGLEAYCDDEPMPLENRDIRVTDGIYYLPADSATTLTGLIFEQDEAAKLLSVHQPEVE